MRKIYLSFKHGGIITKGDKCSILDFGDSAVLVEFSKAFTEDAWQKAHHLASILRKREIKGVREIFPTYTTVLVVFNCLLTDHSQIKAVINEIVESEASVPSENEPSQYFRLPVLFGGEWGPELPFVASHLGISEDEVIDQFCAGFRKIYTFATFCGLLMEGAPFSKRIPRMTSPRTQVPGGYVAVAGNQTAFVPMTSPSGWQTIGHCPVKALDLGMTPPVPYKPGDYIEFFAITEAELSLYEGKPMHDMKVMS